MHSDYLFGGCAVEDRSGGSPTPRVLGMPVSELEVVDSWHTSGLRGTGSHDAVADEVFVPERRSLWLLDPPTSDAPLYRFPIFSFFALSISAAALGIGRGAIDDLKESGGRQGWTRFEPHAGATTRDVGRRRSRGGVAARGARVLLPGDRRDVGGGAIHRPVSVELRVGLRLAATHAVGRPPTSPAACTTWGVDRRSRASPLQRRFRDAHTATAHFQVNPATWELAGRLLLEQPTDTTML